MLATDYEKYLNMNTKQLLNSLLKEEKKQQKIKDEMFQKLNNTEKLIKFLKAQIKENLDKPKNEFLARERTGLDEIALKVENNIAVKEQKKLRKEVQEEMNRNYDEL